MSKDIVNLQLQFIYIYTIIIDDGERYHDDEMIMTDESVSPGAIP